MVVKSNGDVSAPAVFNATSVAEITAALSTLRTKEASVTSRLAALVAAQQDLQRGLGRLDLLRANLSIQSTRSRSISNGMLSSAATTAKRISSSVKKLDLEQSRVKATLEVVDQVAELKACILGVTGSMGAPQDWETAASYLNRASRIPKEVINGAFAARVVPTAEVPDAPNITLENASESLCGLFLREFDKAVKESNGAKITRFFKLFPLIDRSEVGLDVYGRYVCQGVAAQARANLKAGTGGNQSNDGHFFANALSKLFEHIAQIVEGHGGLVERHYGPGKMVRVIERLQVEADQQAGIVLDTWADERHIDRQLTEIKSYAYNFLVQSFLPAQRGQGGTPRSSSPANLSGRASEDEGVDMKEIDALLGEMALMLGRWSLYARFIANKCKSSTDSQDPQAETLPAFLLKSTLMKKIDDKLVSTYNTMTTFFFRRSVEKAFQLDEQPGHLSLNPHKPLNSNPPYISSAVDDTMYIMKKVLQQSLATSRRDVVCSVVPALGRVMGSDFIGMIQRKMRDESYPKAAIAGHLPPEYTIVAFIVLVNDLDVAIDYVSRIVKSQIQPPTVLGKDGSPEQNPLDSRFPVAADAAPVSATLSSLSTSFSDKTTELLSDGIHVLFNNVMKPRIRPILLDAFRDTDYQLDAEELRELVESEGFDVSLDQQDAEGGSSELVRMRFQHGWDALTKPIGRIMTERTFDKLLTTVATYLGKLLEKRIWTYSGRVNELGAVRLERDVNAIIGVVVQGRRYSYRDAFLKCSQICMVMNMEAEEWGEMQIIEGQGGLDGMADRLSEDERERARGMIQDTE